MASSSASNRNRPHFYLPGRGKPEGFTTTVKSRTPPLPKRDRLNHATALRAALRSAVDAANDPIWLSLDFELSSGSRQTAEALELPSKGIELVSVRSDDRENRLQATVLLPGSAVSVFSRKIDQYQNEETKKGNPRNQGLIARIEEISLASVKSVFSGEDGQYPNEGEQIWWEVWIRQGFLDAFQDAAASAAVPVDPLGLEFPDRIVRLAFASVVEIAPIFLNSGSVAELRRAASPSSFRAMKPTEQREWITDLERRLVLPQNSDFAVSILDTGVSLGHPLLRHLVSEQDVHSVNPTWAKTDRHGHGTNMAGTVGFGDLAPLLLSSEIVRLSHVVESVKILPDGDKQNSPSLHGAIIKEAVSRLEVEAPNRKRTTCMAVTSDQSSGRPSSRPAAIDQLCFGDHGLRRLLIVSAGNVRDHLDPKQYPDRNALERIENPAQAWNAITVGAYTEKTALTDASYDGWWAVADAGDLSPHSRTAVNWAKPWPIKPEILLEGGNWATDGNVNHDEASDELSILTTGADPMRGHFETFNATSAATALAGNLAGRLMAAVPERWPETWRGLLVHSAEWTAVMEQKLEGCKGEIDKLTFLRTYGYGVPSYERAVRSAESDVTLVCEDQIQPFEKVGSNVKTRHMNLHELPWPKKELEELGAADVELRVTLSYFIDPNPGERGWFRRHRYASHMLRFEMKRPTETLKTFRSRINKQVATEESSMPDSARQSESGWLFGRVRNRGSLHSDYWRGSAADLASCGVLAMFPVGGWWKENPKQDRHKRSVRYSLLVTLRANADIYTAVAVQIATEIETDTSIPIS